MTERRTIGEDHYWQGEFEPVLALAVVERDDGDETMPIPDAAWMARGCHRFFAPPRGAGQAAKCN